MRKLISAAFLVLLVAVVLISCENPSSNPTKSYNANLSGLSISSGTLIPEFNTETTNYSVNVQNDITNITVTGTKADVNGSLSSNNGVAQSLNVGTNTITITVTAQDGTTTKDYVVNVIRDAALSTNADLSGLAINTGTISPTFITETTEYSVSVSNDTTSIIVTGTKVDNNASLSVNNGVAQDLEVGINTITIIVTAEDGITVKSYEISVTREPPEYFTILFQSNGGSFIDSQQIVTGDKVDKPVDPVKNQDTFHGWFYDEYCINEWDFFSQIVNNNITLYAKWDFLLSGNWNLVFGSNNFDLSFTNSNILINADFPDIVIGYENNRKEALLYWSYNEEYNRIEWEDIIDTSIHVKHYSSFTNIVEAENTDIIAFEYDLIKK